MSESAGKYLGERSIGNVAHDLFDFRCRWCDERSILACEFGERKEL